MTKNKKIIAVAGIVLIIAILAGVYFVFGNKTAEGTKKVTLTVVDSGGKSVSYKVATDGEVLTDAMEKAKEDGFTYSGEESEYGLVIYEVNGEKTDFQTCYWGILVDGEEGMYGADSQPLTDGSEYSLVYTKI